MNLQLKLQLYTFILQITSRSLKKNFCIQEANLYAYFVNCRKSTQATMRVSEGVTSTFKINNNMFTFNNKCTSRRLALFSYDDSVDFCSVFATLS